MNSGSTISARVTHHFPHPAERVFDAWLSADLIGRWMFGPNVREEEIVRLNLDARVGGTFSFVVRRDGKEFDHIGKYLELDRPHRLAFTWGVVQDGGDKSRVFVDFIPTANGCDVSLAHEMGAEWEEFVPRCEASWVKMLASLEKQLS
jgi:uncharacterized protein YndB with AHSA1/START domain